jgi:hypothetical protein
MNCHNKISNISRELLREDTNQIRRIECDDIIPAGHCEERLPPSTPRTLVVAIWPDFDCNVEKHTLETPTI